jgi:signal transduction histidine kinase
VRRAGAPWLLDAIVVLAALATVGLLVVSTRYSARTFDRSSAWDRSLAEIQGRIDARTDLAGARARCAALVRDGARVAPLCRHLDAQHLAAAYTVTAAQTARRRRTLDRLNVALVVGVLLLFGGIALAVARRARQLATHNERLRRLDALKDTFIASVSHELRTPLTSTIGFLQTLERPDLALPEEQRRELIGISRAQAERLAALVDDLLLFAGTQQRPLALARAQVDVARLLEERARRAEPAARDKGVVLDVQTGDVPGVAGDGARLAQLFDNLLANAVKFTPRGGRVDLSARAGDGSVRVEVADTGVGIPAAEQPYLFDRFFRSPSTVKNAVPGAGIGLAISKAIVDAHGGAISVESTEGSGTTVVVDLPLSGSAPAA